MSLNVESLYRTYGPMVLRRCRFLLKNEDAAVDAMQDTFVNIIKNQDRLSSNASVSLLYRTATNVCLNKIRADRVRDGYGASTILKNIANHHQPESRLSAWFMLSKLFSKHTEETQYIAVLYFLDRFTLEEVSAQVGLSVSCIRDRLRLLKTNLMNLEA